MKERKPRSKQLIIRMLPELRQRIEDDATEQEMPAAAVARKILVRHYEGKS